MDTLDEVVVGVLLQKGLDSKIYLVAYFLKTMLLTKVNYKIYDKEILAIIRVLE